MKTIEIKRLKLYKLFEGLADNELKLVAELTSRQEFNAGSVIIYEDDVGNDLFLLEDGVVDIHKTLTIVASKNEFGTKERSFLRLNGDHHLFFGEMALFGNGKRSATVKAVTKCILYQILDTDFNKLCKEHPRIGFVVVRNIAHMLADNLRKTNEDVIKLTTALSLALSTS